MHCLSPHGARPLAGILLYGARTFLRTISRPATAWRTSGRDYALLAALAVRAGIRTRSASSAGLADLAPLPDTAQVGERVGVYITAGLVTGTLYELDLVTAASGSMINGADASSTPWSRLFIANETVIFRCIKAGGAGDTDCIVEHNGRIACVAFLYRGSDSSAVMTANTFVQVTFTAIVSGQEVGGISVLASNYVQPRRAGIYRVDGMVRMGSAASGIAIAQIRDPQATPTYSFRGPNTGANGGSTLDGSVGGYFPVTHANLAATAGRISMYGLHNSGSSTLPIHGLASPNFMTRLVVREEFR